MIKSMKKGASQMLAMLLVFGTAVFAFQVTGTVKTWTTNETLTATDLNTTVQSLKTAVENATQYGELSFEIHPSASGDYFLGFNSGVGGLRSKTVEKGIPARRAGTVKNARIELHDTNLLQSNCTVTLRKNGADTAISFSLTAASSASITDSNTVSFVAGDLLNWKHTCYGSNMSNYPVFIVSFEF